MSDIGIGLVLFAGVLTLVGIIRFLAWLTDLQERHGSLGRAGINTVKRYAQPRAHVMSRSDNAPAQSPRPSLETAKQTDGQTDMQPRIKAEQLLTVYKLMRAAGIGREDAAAAFKASGLPFNNNVWRDAEPPAKATEDEIVTPYAGRRTKASYYPGEPELEYQSP